MAHPSNPDLTLPFSKFRGTPIEQVPTGYLKWLCLWDNYKATQKTQLRRDPEKWLWKSHPKVVHAAREIVKKRNLCRVCFHPLVPIGNARANGKPHADWYNRCYHKQCWQDLDTDSESDTA